MHGDRVAGERVHRYKIENRRFVIHLDTRVAENDLDLGFRIRQESEPGGGDLLYQWIDFIEADEIAGTAKCGHSSSAEANDTDLSRTFRQRGQGQRDAAVRTIVGN